MQNVDELAIEKSIVLIGFMGAGKTTIGKLVANKLDRDFVDIDDEIEKEYGMPVTEIFKKLGETEFREKEKKVTTSFCKQKLKVLSLGGGAFLQEEIRHVCMEECVVIFLDLSWERWKDRLRLIIDSRPVLQGKSLDEIKELFDNRRKIYAHHHIKVETDYYDSEAAANYIVDSLKNWIGNEN